MDIVKTHCELHQEALIADFAKIVYGLPDLSSSYWEARAKLFPNSHLTMLGGCVFIDSDPKMHPIMCCLSCRDSEHYWIKQKNRPFSETFD